MEPYPIKKIQEARAPKVTIEAAREVYPHRYGPTGGTGLSAWGIWNVTYTTGGTTLTASTTNSWNIWNASYPYANTTSVTNTWTHWINQPMTEANVAAIQRDLRHGQAMQRAALGAPAVITAEQRAESQRREREYLEAEQKRVSAIALARKRAKTLLLQCLTPEQREDVEKKGCFYLDCHSANGTKRRYRIDATYTHGNVKLVDDKNNLIGQYCVQPNGVPIEDAVLAQKLWLETNEEEFKRKANYTPYHGYQRRAA